MKKILIALIFLSGIARAQVLQKMELVMGPLPKNNHTAFNVKITDSLVEEDHTRYTINFTVAENEILPALLYIPHKKGKLPGMLVLHGTDPLGKMVLSGISTKPNRAYAKELAQRGYVVIAPDYPTFGDMKDYDFEKDRYVSGTMKGIFDHIRCIDLLQSRPEVDPNRIGVIGHSLGGHNAIFVAAFDPRIKVIVASSSWTLMDYYNIGEEASKKFGGRLGPWAQTRYMPLIRDKYELKEIPFDFDELIAYLAPRPFFNNSPLKDANFDVKGVEKGMVYITKAYKDLKASDKLQVRYPDAGHDFPPKERQEAYEFIDKVLHYKGVNKPLLF
ncbi:alpha/beta fold hydrolase [Chitinophaga sp. SYP-B3965]|uniref:alpha/beta hydrolase family protein n=1 Tax=Chitinophaga sp. SYP-B3965 TaxID=2663120 RepID=UPI00129977D6|nr:alpha/beta fold hydrolase [Chitinophaga sp. SYP-B3965]MRG46031.1 alpha/beta fold hydrolase [Chitinophaga sp. SYP-B3965]